MTISNIYKKAFKLKVLNATHLKLIASICMLIDHIGYVLFPDVVVLRIIGRISMPIFAFCISESYRYTKNQWKFLLRLGIFAVISEIPFDLACNMKLEFGYQNVMFTFFISVLAMISMDKVMESKHIKDYGIKLTLTLLTAIMFGVVAILLRTDYSVYGVMTVCLFYFLRKQSNELRAVSGVLFLSLTDITGYHVGIYGSIPLLFMYNRKKGKGLKWFFYIFYPGHLLLLYIIYKLLIG